MKIHIYDEFSPQDTAMMQALYSRSSLSVTEHVKKVRQSGSGNFMKKFYVGYGHASIADCGSTTIFIEGVSILADKAIQDWPLYSGQETSTRYIDMSKQPIIDPKGTKSSKAILDRWMRFYVSSQDPVKEHLKKKYPRKENEDEAVYKKAINARSFDILRGFLPAGITTQLSWHTNLRQAADKLALLRHHPLPEVKNIARDILSKLKVKYPESFCQQYTKKQEAFWKQTVKKYNYFKPSKKENFVLYSTVKRNELAAYKDILSSRPEKTSLPLFLGDLGQIQFKFKLDFGSFRDIQRHRNGVCRMPLLTVSRGFNQWYLDQLPKELQKEAKILIASQKKEISKLDVPAEIKQYYVALGFNVDCQVTYPLPAAVYVVELRSSRYVHPTLRKIAHQMYEALRKKFPELKMNVDLQPDDWDVRRGLQDIGVKK
jgi:thymidylate synthase ThyX